MKCKNCKQCRTFTYPESYEEDVYCNLGYEPQEFSDGDLGCRHWAKYIYQGIKKRDK